MNYFFAIIRILCLQNSSNSKRNAWNIEWANHEYFILHIIALMF